MPTMMRGGMRPLKKKKSPDTPKLDKHEAIGPPCDPIEKEKKNNNNSTTTCHIICESHLVALSNSLFVVCFQYTVEPLFGRRFFDR